MPLVPSGRILYSADNPLFPGNSQVEVVGSHPVSTPASAADALSANSPPRPNRSRACVGEPLPRPATRRPRQDDFSVGEIFCVPFQAPCHSRRRAPARGFGNDHDWVRIDVRRKAKWILRELFGGGITAATDPTAI